MTNGQNTNNGSVMSEIGSTYKPPSASSQPNSYTPQANPSVVDNWKKSAEDVFRNKQTQADIKEFFGDAVEFAGPLLQAMGLGWIQNMFNRQSENRANAEYDRRVADERAYNDPLAVAQRYAKAGINPLSVMTNGGPITSSTTSAPTASSNNLGGLSGLANLLQTPTKIDLNKAKTENTGVDTILKNWDSLLKDQLYNYNNKANPILLEKGLQELSNLRQTYNNLVSTEGLQKAQTSEVYKKMQKLEEEITLLVFQQVLTQEQASVEEQKWRKLVEDIDGQKISNQIQFRTLEDYYNSGIFKAKSEAEKREIENLANKTYTEAMRLAQVFSPYDGENFALSFWNKLLYLITEII